MKVFIIFFVVFVYYSVGVPISEWEKFKKLYGISYDDEREDTFRMGIYFENKHRINEHNALYEAGEVTFKLGMNKFGAFLDREVPLMALNQDNKLAEEPYECGLSAPLKKKVKAIEAATALDWRKKGLVGSVKDQGDCNSAWAFSAVGAVESSMVHCTGKFIDLSVQRVMDCSTPLGNRGCEAGTTFMALFYMVANGSVAEESYPYNATSGEECLVLDDPIKFQQGMQCIHRGDETDLLEKLKYFGPVSVTIDASSWKFRFYHSGIYKDDECSSSIYRLNHPMLLVGHNSTSGSSESYWIVKNSWGKRWGEDGYMKLSKDSEGYENHCGIATKAISFYALC